MQRRFLTEILYNKHISCGRSVPEISLRELKARMAGSVQGTWILCAGGGLARRVMEALDPCPLDLSIGSLPGDERAFNSVVVCPQETGDWPRALRTLALAGVPAPDAEIPGVEILRIEGTAFPAELLPDVNQMREVYKAARSLNRRPVRIADMEELACQLAEETGLGETACHASLLALLDMQLVEIRQKPFGLNLPPMQKTDPMSSALWRAICNLKNSSEGRELE